MESSICLDEDQDFLLYNTTADNDNSLVYMEINYCTNTTIKSDCYPMDDILKRASQIQIGILFSN